MDTSVIFIQTIEINVLPAITAALTQFDGLNLWINRCFSCTFRSRQKTAWPRQARSGPALAPYSRPFEGMRLEPAGGGSRRCRFSEGHNTDLTAAHAAMQGQEGKRWISKPKTPKFC